MYYNRAQHQTRRAVRNARSLLLSSGFTLIEAMVAVALLALAVAGPLYAAGRALVAAELAKDRLTASYLAQEGIEYVRAMRDDEYLAAYTQGGANISGTAWTNFMTSSDNGSISGCHNNTCTLDATQPMGTSANGQDALQPCSGNTCTALYLNSSGLYTRKAVGGTTPTPFIRTVEAVDVPGSANEEAIISTVTWQTHGQTYTVSVQDNLTAWQ